MTTQKYNVQMYVPVCIKVANVEAESMVAAMQQAEECVQDSYHDLLDRTPKDGVLMSLANGASVDFVSYTDDQAAFFLVDTLKADGGVDYSNTCWFGPDLKPCIDGDTTIELAGKRAALSQKFMNEILASVENLCGLADTHGIETLADILYLQKAILDGDTIDDSEESSIVEFVEKLPSGEQWVTFIQVEQKA